ncbi:hypothetical protein [Zeimonas arvi]|uniref:Uncharacterized protein n=1 Tax=Zeimonas arvi TaxID=2498847 RepID=A0A5C8NN04_9BURK|nr:hypothetical protein [Zeimonas arvi]TXL62467.1 hypothetical protein FHP08_18055 [Zeimonas arvi]
MASQLGDAGEAERLFLLGYREGLAFIASVQAGKIPHEIMRTEVPWLMKLLLQGPTPDFMLGRVYEAAVDSALEDVLKTGDRLNDEELKKSIATRKYHNWNCKILGRNKSP